MLNLDKAGARDPLSSVCLKVLLPDGPHARKLDDDLPELTEGVVSLLWPHYLRTIPSMSVVEVHPRLAGNERSMTMGKGFEVLSRPIGEKGTRCRYTTTKAIALAAVIPDASSWPPIRSAVVITLRFTAALALTDWRRSISVISATCTQRRCATLAYAMHRPLPSILARMAAHPR